MKTLIIFTLTLLLAVRIYAQNIGANNYKIYDVNTKHIITIDQFADSLGDFDMLFFGENHDDAVVHYLEDTLYNILCSKFSKVALSMEAFSTDCQIVLNEFLEGFITEEKFKSNAYVWEPFYRGYSKILNSAKRNKLPVLAANAPDRYVELVAERGMAVLDSLGEDSKKFLPPLPYNVKHDSYYELYKRVMQKTILFTDSSWQSFALYNAAMSYNINKFWLAHKGYKIMSINGSFHSDYRNGIVNQLLQLNNTVKIKIISSFKSPDLNNLDWSDIADRADFIILTDPSVKGSFLP